MQIGSIKIVSFDNTKEGRALKQQFGKRLVVEVLEDEHINPQGRKQVKVRVLFTHASNLKFLIGKDFYLPVNLHVMWTLRNGSNKLEDEKPRIVLVNYEQQHEHWSYETY